MGLRQGSFRFDSLLNDSVLVFLRERLLCVQTPIHETHDIVTRSVTVQLDHRCLGLLMLILSGVVDV